MRKGGGKAKGASFEREVCKHLSLYVSNGERDDLFWRSAMSGGRATLQARKGKKTVAQVGDISAIDPLGDEFLRRVVIECKCYRDLDIVAGILMGRGRLLKFWSRLCVEASKLKREPVLIAKQNGLPVIAIMSGAVIGYSGNALMTLHGWPESPDVHYFEEAFPIVTRKRRKKK